MNNMMTQAEQAVTEHTVAQAVRKRLPPRLSSGITLEVVEPQIHKEEHWWSVPVRPSVEPVKRYEFYEILAETEIDIDEQEHLKVFLVPAGADQGG